MDLITGRCVVVQCHPYADLMIDNYMIVYCIVVYIEFIKPIRCADIRCGRPCGATHHRSSWVPRAYDGSRDSG